VRQVGLVVVVGYPLCVVRRFVGPCTLLGLMWWLVPGECGPVGPPVVWWWGVLGIVGLRRPSYPPGRCPF